MLLRYCLGDFEMVTVAPIITGITFASSFSSSSSYYYGSDSIGLK
jgi:hypothetical protein